MLVWEPRFVAAFRGARRAAGRPAQHPKATQGPKHSGGWQRGCLLQGSGARNCPPGKGKKLPRRHCAQMGRWPLEKPSHEKGRKVRLPARDKAVWKRQLEPRRGPSPSGNHQQNERRLQSAEFRAGTWQLIRCSDLGGNRRPQHAPGRSPADEARLLGQESAPGRLAVTRHSGRHKKSWQVNKIRANHGDVRNRSLCGTQPAPGHSEKAPTNPTPHRQWPGRTMATPFSGLRGLNFYPDLQDTSPGGSDFWRHCPRGRGFQTKHCFSAKTAGSRGDLESDWRSPKF